MRQHILLPIDFSDNAWSAALYAINLFANKPCTFYFSHAWTFVNTGARTYIAPNYIDALKDASKTHLSEFRDRAKKESSNAEHEFKIIFSVDTLTDSIKDAVEKYNVDLVVMGTKGATGAKEFFLGSNTVTVISRLRNCPIILVPNNYEFVTPDQIAFPSDFKRKFGEELRDIDTIAQLYDSIINVVHIKGKEDLSEVQQENLETLKDYWSEHPININCLPEEGSKEHVITNYIQEENIKFLAMISYKHDFFENLIKEPVVKNLGFHSKIPFLVIPKDV